jgi:hypothetical protein
MISHMAPKAVSRSVQAMADLAEALASLGWHVQQPAKGPDLLYRSGPRRLAVELRAARGRVPLDDLRAKLADALLVARARAERLGAEPLAVVAASALSDRAIAELERYVSEVAPGCAWGAVDARGRWHFVGEGLADLAPPAEGVAHGGSPALLHRARAESPPQNPFSDLSQWMLKVLLAPRLPRLRLFGVEPVPPIRGVVDLARRASVAPSRASALVAALEHRGHVERWRRELRLVRIADLLDDWCHAANAVVHDVPVRIALPAADPARRLEKALAERARSDAEPRVCLGLFSAAAKHGAHFVRGAPLHAYLESAAAEHLSSIGLVRADHPVQADLHARIPRFRESVFRGVSLVDRVPAADLLQCWLDVSMHPVRGEEQAAEIAQLLGLEDLE